jgi:lysozyme
MNWYKKSSQPKEEIVPPFARSMPYANNLNWYKLAVLEYQLHKEAGVKEGILAALLSILSSISLPYEARAIRNLLDRHNIDQVQQQKIVSTVNELTDQNKNIDELNIDDIKTAIENVKKDLREENMSNRNITAGELNIEDLKNTIRKHEGKSNKVYLDPSKKNWCVGYGFNLNKPNSKEIIRSIGADYNAIMSGKQSLSDAQVEKILDISVKEAVDIASSFVVNYNQLPSKAKLVIANMAFMGRGTLGKFNDLRDALVNNDYNKAADEMLDSIWAKQVGKRATELAEMMRSLG